MTLWDENIDKVNEGDSVNVKNGYVRPFKGSMRLNIGRYGSLEPAETPLGDVNTQNNLSDKQVEEERPYRPYGGGGRSSEAAAGTAAEAVTEGAAVVTEEAEVGADTAAAETAGATDTRSQYCSSKRCGKFPPRDFFFLFPFTFAISPTIIP